MSTQPSKPTVVRLPRDANPDRTEHLVLYAVNGEGKVVETAPFKDQTAVLTGANRHARLFVGARFPEAYPADRIDVYSLVKAGYAQIGGGAGAKGEIQIQHLPSRIGPIAELFFCEVQGNVTNTVNVNGIPHTGPLCQARVHICAVEWYWRWPIWLRPVVPLHVVDHLKATVAALHGRPTKGLRRRAKAAAPRSSATLRPLPAHVEAEISAATPETIHDIVAKYPTILYPYFCWWEIFWPWFYRVVEQDVVYTDCNGHFDDWLISVGAPVDENIYVWVEANIGGTWTTVYNPPFPCATWWNYACGTEINIALNNPNIPPCNCNVDVVDGSAWFTAVGQYAIAANIQQDVASVSAAGGIANVGCTNLFDGNQLCPFGAGLDLGLAFGPTKPATHYRWRWAYVRDSAGNPISGGAPHYVTGALARPYLWPLSGGSFEAGAIQLQDTDADGNIAYLIPDYDVTAYPGVSPLAEWVSFNFVSASIDSTKISNGYVVQFDLELMNKNAAGVFEVVSVPVDTFQVSINTDAGSGYGGSTPAPYTAGGGGNNYLTLDPSIPGNALSFSLKVKVDNSPVTAHINDALLVESGAVSGPCGFITFDDTGQHLDLSFVASEPFNFATFSYGVTKGDSPANVISTSGYVFQSAASSPAGAPAFTLSAGTFSAAPTVGYLLGTCPQAAFAELLTVASLATNGTSPLSASGYPYYAEETNAFALTPSA